MQSAVQKCHVAVGRDDVSAVGRHRHAVLNFENLHSGVAANQLGEDALVVRRQMLDQHKRHAGIGINGHAGEKRLKCRQPAGGGTNADERETAGHHVGRDVF